VITTSESVLYVTLNDVQIMLPCNVPVDGNGNITDYVDADGTVKAHYEYGPFGGITASSGDKRNDFTHRFSTKPYEEETGILRYQLRDYIVELARWTSRDPIQENGGLNLYGFVGNNSVTWTDAFGLYFSFPDPEPILIITEPLPTTPMPHNPIPPSADVSAAIVWKCYRCGPDVTAWLWKRMVNNAASDIVKEIANHNVWSAWSYAEKLKAYKKWTELVGQDGSWDFKRYIEKNVKVACRDGRTCPEKPCQDYITLCGKCYHYHVVASIHYGYVGRVAAFSLTELLLGSGMSELWNAGQWDPPSDRAAINVGWNAFEKGLCPAVKMFDSDLKKEDACAICPEAYVEKQQIKPQ
jgi:RHS repeat-associated protein